MLTSGAITAIGILLSVLFLPMMWMVFGIIGSIAVGALYRFHRSLSL